MKVRTKFERNDERPSVRGYGVWLEAETEEDRALLAALAEGSKAAPVRVSWDGYWRLELFFRI